MNIRTTGTPKRPTLSLHFADKPKQEAAPMKRRSPTLSDRELRREVAAMIG